ncbi:MAG: SulP family inorganic anion transporter [Betaproteobacteria bacterium]
MLQRLFPFLSWFPPKQGQIKADLIAGITVALVLIPQSMAYAQLAGMPAYFGLYAAFLPVMIAAMWGSSSQLGTGPVAVVSLLTASSLAPFATAGSSEFIALAILLSLLVGAIQLSLGIFKLGIIVNFLSHPVIVGFTNAAAIIIALSQLNKMLGLQLGSSGRFIIDVVTMLGDVGHAHLPTLLMGLVALAIMAVLRKKAPKAPGVLIAVALTTLVSWGIGFEKTANVKVSQVAEPTLRAQFADFMEADGRLKAVSQKMLETAKELSVSEKSPEQATTSAVLRHQVDLLRIEQKSLEASRSQQLRTLRKLRFERQGEVLQLAGTAGSGTDGVRWRLRRVSGDELHLTGGGDVIGTIPEGLPSIKMPSINLDDIRALFTAALVISLVGFVEAISIAKALAAKSKQRIDPNQELVGQGLANLVGSFTQAFPSSGSFSRSAVNFNAGARTGMSSVFTGLIVMLALLFLTPLLYHLPQATLAAIIIMAVIGLINFSAVKHAWEASRHDGIAAIVTFIATFVFAPHLDNGIIVGAGLAMVLYLYRTMQPRVAILGRHPDGNLRDLAVFPELPRSESVIALRFDGRLYFANVSYFEDAILEAVAANPKVRYLLIVGDAMNEIDASGEEVIHHIVEHLRGSGIEIVFSGLKKQVRDVMQATGLDTVIGAGAFFPNEDAALNAIGTALGENAVAPYRATAGVATP